MRASIVTLGVVLSGAACRPVESKPPEPDRPLIESPSIDTEDDEPRGDAVDEAPPNEASKSPVRSADRPPNTIYRSELERALAGGPAYLLRELGPEAFRINGTFVGWEITRVYPDDPGLCAPGCDIAPGDVILSVNASPLKRPTDLTNLLEQLPRTESLVVESLRDQRRRVVTYRIVEDAATAAP